jgi:thiaminase/transcriptional activator TenA
VTTPPLSPTREAWWSIALEASVPDSFSDWLRVHSEPDWTAVATHPFTQALFDGSLPDERMRSYLVQDYQFVDQFLALLGAAVAKADRYPARLAVSSAITAVTSTENTYFQRAFDALDVPERDRISPALDDVTQAFLDLMAEVNTHGGYAEVLTVLAVAEWSYREWARQAPSERPGNFVHAEWISLHRNPDFDDWVSWLLSDLDRVGAGLSDAERDHCLTLFQRATHLERRFFDAHSGGRGTRTLAGTQSWCGCAQ